MNELKYYIRRARKSDIYDIYDIMYKAFKNISIPYTIYQTDKSVNYIYKLIAKNSRKSNNNIFVICEKNKILGYYHAILYDNIYFLNYIAVAKNVQGLGIGTSLLKHFEGEGKAYSCKKVALELYNNNRQVRNWYLNSGYQVNSSFFNIRISMNKIKTKKNIPLNIELNNWDKACKEEKNYGFSKVEGLCGSGRLTVGLISYNTCKLLDIEGVELKDAVSSICKRFSKDRKILIVTSLSEIPSNWPLLSFVKVFRFYKYI